MRKLSKFLSVFVVVAIGALGLAGPASADAGHVFSIDDRTSAEGSAGGTRDVTVTIRVAPAAQPGEELSVDWATSDAATTATPGTSCAVAGTDYVAKQGSLTFTVLDGASQTISMTLCQDDVEESDETFSVLLFNDRGTCTPQPPCTSTTSIGDNKATFTITDDDPPAMSINDVTVTEGSNSGGITAANFTATLNAASAQTVTAQYDTLDGTATAPADYTAEEAQTVTFPPGDVSETITIDVQHDIVDEANEQFSVNLSQPNNATITDGQGIGTITDDDATPTLAINDVTVAEGDSGTTPATFTVTRTGETDSVVTVDFATADNTAVQPGDYAENSDTLTFAPDDSSETITVLVNGDLADESNESFFVDLSNATNATISDGHGIGTITDDDAAARMSIGDASAAEGDALTFEVTLTNPPGLGQHADVSYQTLSGGANGTATDGTDYETPPESASVRFGPGETEETITIESTEDSIDELDETFTVRLTDPGTPACCGGGYDYTIDDRDGLGTITDDDDPPPSFAIGNASVTEGDTGTTVDATFTVTRSGSTAGTDTIAYATDDDTAFEPGDYAENSDTLTFAPGDTTKEITVVVNGDGTDEADETFFVDLSDASNGTISEGHGIGTIRDDDAEAELTIEDAAVDEGDAGTTSEAVFTVTKSGDTEQIVTVDYATSDDTAVQPGDYAENSDTLTFAPGDTTKEITVVVNGDNTNEADERFFVDLTSPATNATISDGHGIGTITNDDAEASLTIDDVTVNENDAGTTDAVFTVTKSGDTEQIVTVDYATSDDTAVQPGDYAENSDTLTFAPDDTSETITVVVNGDNTNEGADETFFVDLTSPATNATISDGHGIGTIADQDSPIPATMKIGGYFQVRVTAEDPCEGGRLVKVKQSVSGTDPVRAEGTTDSEGVYKEAVRPKVSGKFYSQSYPTTKQTSEGSVLCTGAKSPIRTLPA